MNANDAYELSLKEIQQESLKVLINFDSICKEHNWIYYIAYGTLLGAVRHKGFIPWDDDVDVQMPRKDFNEFVSFCENNIDSLLPFKLCDLKTVKNYPFGIPRFANMDFQYLTLGRGFESFDLGVFIDIYPLDNYCSTYKKALKLRNRIDRINRTIPIFLSGKCAGGVFRTIAKRIAHIFLKFILPNNYPEIAGSKILKLINKKTSDDDIFIGCPAWTTRCNPYKKEWFEGVILLDFENYKLPAPKEYKELLKHIYGDYMKLPPEEKRIPYHEYRIIRRKR